MPAIIYNTLMKMEAHMSILEALDEAERGPTPEQLTGAPLLENWWIQDMGVLRARGDLSGHPSITDPFVTTSPVLGFDVAAGWMRTQSRFYRIGPPLALPGMTIAEAVPLEVVQKLLAVGRQDARKLVQ